MFGSLGQLPWIGAALVLVLLAVACGSDTAPNATAARDAAPKEFQDFDPTNFDNPTDISNEWLPLVPGTQFIFEGTTNENNERHSHQVITTVTDLTKVIGGIKSVVVWDRDFSDGELVEQELAFFAQDDAGAVWRMGEHPEEYLDGVLLEAPTWLAGIAGGKAGISMQARPEEGTPSYSQGLSLEADFIDRARIDQRGQQTCVPAGCYEDVLVIDEFDVDEPEAHQLKYFARGVGNVRVGWAGKDESQEELELTSIMILSEDDLADAGAAALDLESHAYAISEAVYGRTEPAVIAE